MSEPALSEPAVSDPAAAPVLLVDCCAGSRAAWEQTFLLARALRQRETWGGEPPEVWLACPAGGDLAVMANSAGIPLIELERPDAALPLWRDLSSALRRCRVGTLHTLDRSAAGVAAFLRRGRPNLRFVHSVRELPERGGPLPARAAGRADALVFGGSALLHMSRPPENTPARIILPAAPPVPPGPAGLACPLGPKAEPRGDGRFIFAADGPLTPAEDKGLLLQAMAQLQQMNISLPPWELRIAGGGPQFHDLLDLAESLGVKNRLALLGPQPRGVVLDGADAALSSSLGGAGDVSFLLDAWALGLPTACTAIPAHLDIMRGTAEDGAKITDAPALALPPGNPAAMAGAMLSLMREPDARAALAVAGRRALAALTPLRMARAHAALYAELAAPRPA